ncbi:MAG: pilus assembly protein, partial [Hyphomicrobiaceae bacterium]|nr:pilus assembly protein [Hyphomicrobiaceae bacterium]
MEMTNKFKSFFRRFARAQRGNVAIIFGVMMVPTMVLMGGLVDYGMAVKTKSQLTATLDSAMLAAMLKYADDEDVDYEQIIINYIDKNFTQSKKKLHGTVVDVATPTISDEGEMSTTLSVKVPTNFLRLAHFDNFDFKVRSAVMVGGSSIEVALVLDNTGSMAGDKITALKGAANDLLDIILPADKDNSDAKIKFSVVPFADYVNIGVAHRSEDGLDIPEDYRVMVEPEKEVCTDPSSSDDSDESDGPEQVCTPIKEWKTCYNDGVPYSCLRTVGQNCVPVKSDDDDDKDDDDGKDDDDKDDDDKDDDDGKDDDDKDDDDGKDDDDKDDDEGKDDDDKDDDEGKDDDDKDDDEGKDDDDKDDDEGKDDDDDDDDKDDEEDDKEEPICTTVPAKYKNYKWHGCVGSREHDLNTRDDEYDTGVPGM